MMNKDIIYNNIVQIFNDYFFAKYVQMTNDFVYDDSYETRKNFETIIANIFNAILIGCQIFDDRDSIIKFVDEFSLSNISVDYLKRYLEKNGVTELEACNRLKHGFGVHFTTVRICNEIIKSKFLMAYGNNQMITKEEEEIINRASIIQKQNVSNPLENLNYLWKGWGFGTTSYGSMTNYFWMYHTPEFLSFLLGPIEYRDKEMSMQFVLEKISTLSPNDKKVVLNTLSNIYDRLVGDEQSTACILIDRDVFEYEVFYNYQNKEPEKIEDRPYNHGLNSLYSNDCKIKNDISVENLRFLKIPTVKELERMKKEVKHK